MFALGQEAEEIDQKAEVFKNVSEFRDQLFEGNQGKMVKIVGGTLVGLYLVYRFLLK